MSEGIRKAVDELEERRAKQRADVARTEKMINDLLAMIGESARYAEATPDDASVTRAIKRGQFYGKPFATAVREFLQPRKPVPALIDEIVAGLEAGDFDFDALGWKQETRARSLAMSLSKNNVVFHRLPSGAWALKDWYPDLKTRKEKAGAKDSTEGTPVGEANAETEQPNKGGKS